MANYHIIPPELTLSFLQVWPAFQAVNAQLPDSYDLTHILDPMRENGVAIYLDYDHTTEAGNRVKAITIFDLLTVF